MFFSVKLKTEATIRAIDKFLDLMQENQLAYTTL